MNVPHCIAQCAKMAACLLQHQAADCFFPCHLPPQLAEQSHAAEQVLAKYAELEAELAVSAAAASAADLARAEMQAALDSARQQVGGAALP